MISLHTERTYLSLSVMPYLIVMATLCFTVGTANSQTFSSNSTGADGALNLTAAADGPTYVFKPANFAPRPVGDNVYHFTTINIEAGVTVRMSANELNGPVTWLATGDVVIDGDIDLSGENGMNGEEVPPNGSMSPAVGGAGGFPGGLGAVANVYPQQPGYGPGAGKITTGGGGGAGYSSNGGNGRRAGCNVGVGGGGVGYGNDFLVPLMAGSGGAGGQTRNGVNGGSGGAGGGAILIASSTSITLNGSINANGGNGGSSTSKVSFGGGGGSGGAVRLAAVTITGNGNISVAGGAPGSSFHFTNCSYFYINSGYGGVGTAGRSRLEAFNHQFTGTVTPDSPRRSPYGAFPQTSLAAQLMVVSVGGTPLVNPVADFNPPDISLNSNAAVDVVVRAYNIPVQSGDPLVDTVVDLHLLSENSSDVVFSSTSPLIPTGNPGESEVTISVTFPAGFSRGFVHSKWQQ